jgi:hypothetical protein
MNLLPVRNFQTKPQQRARMSQRSGAGCFALAFKRFPNHKDKKYSRYNRLGIVENTGSVTIGMPAYCVYFRLADVPFRSKRAAAQSLQNIP